MLLPPGFFLPQAGASMIFSYTMFLVSYGGSIQKRNDAIDEERAKRRKGAIVIPDPLLRGNVPDFHEYR